jgi:hypothetical protein
MQTAIELPVLRWEQATLDACARYRALPVRAPSADHAAANLYMWDEKYPKEIAFVGACATVRLRGRSGRYYYLFPVGEGDPAPVLLALEKEAAAIGDQLRFVGVSEAELPHLAAQWGEKLQVEETRDFEDYLYDAEKLSTLSGKKLHGKRNHINAFCAAHAWHVERLCPERFEDCLEILDKWQEGKVGELGEEERAIERGFAAWKALSLDGILLYADGEPAAFAVGSRITDTCFCVHFEKAAPGLEGAYPLINREFVRAVREKYPEISTINREEDMGLENLRAAKLSWRPVALLKKYAVALM